LLYVVLAALAGDYWLRERRQPPRPRDTEESRPPRLPFLAVEPGEVREVRLVRRGRTIVSRVSDGRWAIAEPPGAAIPGDLIQAFMSALAGAEEIDRLTGGDPQSFGLGEGAARVELVDRAGKAVVVTLGGTNPTGTAIYARRDDAAEVVLIGRNVRYYEDLIFQALPTPHVPTGDGNAPVGG
jgi:hypothetical protein